MTLKERMNGVVELLCEDEDEAKKLAQAFAIYWTPSVPVNVLTESYGTVVYWYETAGILRRGAEEEEEESAYRDAERILGAAERFIDKTIMTSMHVNKNLRYFE